MMLDAVRAALLASMKVCFSVKAGMETTVGGR